jgi:phage terminase large subunit-like protein
MTRWWLVLRALARQPEARQLVILRSLPPPALRALAEEWHWQAHRGQREPEGDWRVWMLVAGRGFGKTRTGAEWVSRHARDNGRARIALAGATLGDVARVMVEGPSGILSVAWTGEAPRWTRSRGLVEFSSGAVAFAYGGERPGQLRGPEHHFAWADELAKWTRPEESWHNLQMGLRLGERPRVLVTTTPRPMPLLERILAEPGTTSTGGRMRENLHLAPAVVAELEALYAGTRIGRQELDGELFHEVEGALWTRALIEQCRATMAERRVGDGFARIVVGVDPPASATGDACGIVVCGLGQDGISYVLADCTVAGAGPERWARAVAEAAAAWGADRVVAEKNQGGDMVEAVLKSVDEALPVVLVSATRGKSARAEPVAARFEAGKARLAGCFPELEDQLCALTVGGDYAGRGSPDRADACVWALTWLIKGVAEPSIRML